MEFEEDLLIYNPLINKYPLGAVKCEEMVTVKLTFPSHFIVYGVTMIIEDDNSNVVSEIGMKDNSFCFSIDKWGIYWYYFRFYDCYGMHYLVPGSDLTAKITNELISKWNLSVYICDNSNVNWFSEGIMYQIFPDRFYKEVNLEKKGAIIHKDWFDVPYIGEQEDGRWNIDFYGGNLKGIIAKLDYLKELNVTSIYLNPIFLSPSSHRYDTSDYLMIDPLLGTEQDFIDLCSIAKEKGIRIIIDMVLNHTGDDSIYFNKYGNFASIGAYESNKSPYYDWYDFSSKYKYGYRCWWDVPSLPSINQKSKSYREFISHVLTKWISLGASGVRLDVVDELDDDTVELIHNAVKGANPNAIIIGEVWENAATKIAYDTRRHYFNGLEIDSVMNYVFAKAIIKYVKDNDYVNLRNNIRMVLNDYPSWAVNKLMNILDTHDTFRLLNYFYDEEPETEVEMLNYVPTKQEKKIAKLNLKKASLLQFSLPGVPCLYYGDEAGLSGFSDPFSRLTYPWGREDKELLEWYKKLSSLRNFDSLKKGTYSEIHYGKDYVSFIREFDDEKVLVVINNSNEVINLNYKALDLLNDLSLNIITIDPQMYGIYLLK